MTGHKYSTFRDKGLSLHSCAYGVCARNAFGSFHTGVLFPTLSIDRLSLVRADLSSRCRILRAMTLHNAFKLNEVGWRIDGKNISPMRFVSACECVRVPLYFRPSCALFAGRFTYGWTGVTLRLLAGMGYTNKT